MKQLLKDEIISIDYVKLERNLANPLTKPLGRKHVLATLKEMGPKLIFEINNDGNPTFVIRDATN